MASGQGMRFVVVSVIVGMALSVGADAQTLLNGHFATPYTCYDSNTTVANSWTYYRISRSPRFKQSDSEQMPGGPSGVTSQQIWADYSQFDAGVYQRISGTTVGRKYRVAGWFLSINQFGVTPLSPPFQDGGILQQIGIDPHGGADPNSASIVWSFANPLDRRWREITVDAVAQSTTITVFARVNNLYAYHNCLSFFDAFTFFAGVNPIVISNVAVRPGVNQATVTWTTDVPADSTIDLWQYRGQAKEATSYTNSTLTTQHSLTLTGLSALSQYFFRITSSANGRICITSYGDPTIDPFKTMRERARH